MNKLNGKINVDGVEYELGGSSGARLVATGVISEYAYNGFNLNKKLEPNKMYFVVFYNGETQWRTTTIITTKEYGDVAHSIFTDVLWFDTENKLITCSLEYFYSNQTNASIFHLDPIDSNLNIDSLLESDTSTCEVYELGTIGETQPQPSGDNIKTKEFKNLVPDDNQCIMIEWENSDIDFNFPVKLEIYNHEENCVANNVKIKCKDDGTVITYKDDCIIETEKIFGMYEFRSQIFDEIPNICVFELSCYQLDTGALNSVKIYYTPINETTSPIQCTF